MQVLQGYIVCKWLMRERYELIFPDKKTNRKSRALCKVEHLAIRRMGPRLDCEWLSPRAVVCQRAGRCCLDPALVSSSVI